MMARPGARGEVRPCQLINLIRTGLAASREGHNLQKLHQSSLTRGANDDINHWKDGYFWKHSFGWSVPINGMTGSLFVKVFWSAECPGSGLFISIYHLAGTRHKCPGETHSPGVYDFLSFQFSLIASLCRDTGLESGPGTEGHLGVIEIIKAPLSRLTGSDTNPVTANCDLSGSHLLQYFMHFYLSCFSRR